LPTSAAAGQEFKALSAGRKSRQGDERRNSSVDFACISTLRTYYKCKDTFLEGICPERSWVDLKI